MMLHRILLLVVVVISIVKSSLSICTSQGASGCCAAGAVVIGSSVTSINSDAFNGCSQMTSITIPTTVQYIGSQAFMGCTSLTSISIPIGIQYIYSGAFMGCTSLASVIIDSKISSSNYYNYYNFNSNLYISSNAFQGCTALTSVTLNRLDISTSVCTLFPLVPFTSVTILNSVTYIGSNAFEGCTSLTSVSIPGSILSIGSQAFKGCTALTSVTMDSTASIKKLFYYNSLSISSDSFQGCTALTSVTLNRFDFSGTSVCTLFPLVTFTSIIVPSSDTTIGNKAFQGCTSLKSVSIPYSVTSISPESFQGCTSLTAVSILNSKARIHDSSFAGCTSLKCIYFSSDENKYYRNTNSLKSCCPPGSVIKDMSCYRTCEAPFEYYDSSSNSCVQCPYLTASTDSNDIYWGENIYRCNYLHFGLNKGGTILILLLLILVFISCLAFIRDENNKFDFKLMAGFFVVTTLPVLNVLTDFVYVTQMVFQDAGLFVTAIIFLLIHGLLFFKFLFLRGIRAKFWIIPMPQYLFFESYNNIYKFLFTGVAGAPFVLINLPVLIPLLFIGYVLYTMKVMSIIRVYKKWVYLYSGVYNGHDDIDKTMKFTNNMVIDSHILNASIHEEIIFESLPLIIIEIINNVIMVRAVPLAYVPVVVCGLNVLSGIYHIIYYRIYRRIPIVDIPIKIDVMGVVLINLNEISDNNTKAGNGEGFDPDRELCLELTDVKSSTQLQRIINLEKNIVEITERLSLLEDRNANIISI